MSSSGWMTDEAYDRMEADARAKKPEDRLPWEVNMLESIDEMRWQEKLDRHWFWRPMCTFLLFGFLAPIVFMFYKSTQLMWSIYGDGIIQVIQKYI